MIRRIIIGQVINRIVSFLLSIGVPKSIIPDVKPSPVEWPQKYDETPLTEKK